MEIANIKSAFRVLLLILFAIIFTQNAQARNISTVEWQHATAHVVKKYEPTVDAELIPYFHQAHVSYPPKDIALLTFKEERHIELWAKDNHSNWAYIRTYPLTASSGKAGPKLQMNDSQIPEGIYKIVELNPFSSQHLSMMLNYPNEFDRVHAKEDGRTNLGNNIFIHGKNLSVGCLAVGDAAIDQLFVLVDRVGERHTTVIIAPNDLRVKKPVTSFWWTHQPKWLPELYTELTQELNTFTPVAKTRA